MNLFQQHSSNNLQLHLSHNIWKDKQDLIYLLKQLPPKPGPDCRNLDPILESLPIAFATSFTSAPVTSQIADIEFIELIL